MHRSSFYLILALVVGLGPFPACGNPKPDDGKKALPPLTVAILDFEANAPGSPDLGKQVSELLTVTLGNQDGYTLVDRATMHRILQEHELDLTGVVDPATAVKVGKLVGAKILITGKVFPLDRQLFFTAKLIGTETSLIQAVLVKGDKDADIGEMILKFSDKVAAKLRDDGSKLLAPNDVIEDPLPVLKKALEGRKLPRISVHIQERNLPPLRQAQGEPATTERVDLAVETEMRMVLKDAGFTIIGGDEKVLEEGRVTVAVEGEAFSELAARIANLVSCSARVEIKITDRKTNEVLFSDRETTRGVDLAENLAGKSALQNAGHILGIRILRHFVEILPPVDKKNKPTK